MVATAQQIDTVGRMITAHPNWYRASYEFEGNNVVVTTPNGAVATVEPDGTTTFSIVLHP